MRTYIYLHKGKYTVINIVNINTALLTSFCVSLKVATRIPFAGMLFYMFFGRVSYSYDTLLQLNYGICMIHIAVA